MHPEGEWVRVADVLARARGVDSSGAFEAEALALAKTMRQVAHDWDDQPCVTWSTARELLESLRAEAARKQAEVEAQLVAADEVRRARIPRGIPAGVLPEDGQGLAMMLSDPDWRRSRRQSVLEHALEHPSGALVYTSLQPDGSEIT